jgi:hypothetical protein
MSTNGVEQDISAPKSIGRLEEIAEANAERRRLEEMEDLVTENDEKLTIGGEISLDDMVETLGGHGGGTRDNNSILGEVEVLA